MRESEINMRTKEERLKRKALGEKRKELMRKILKQADKCECKISNIETCKNCQKVAKMSLGLKKFMTKRVIIEGIAEKDTDDFKHVTRLKMTLEEYNKYKSNNLTDQDIAKIKNVSSSAVTRFKQKNGISKGRYTNIS